MHKNVLDVYFTDQARAFPITEKEKEFSQCCYWLFFNDAGPRGARARNDVPSMIVDGLDDEEKELVKKQIYERLDAGDFKELYVVIFVYWKEKAAIPLLKRYLKDFKIRHKASRGHLASYEMKFCKDAIRMLKKDGQRETSERKEKGL